MKKKKKLIWQLYPSYLLITIISVVAVTWYASDQVRPGGLFIAILAAWV